MKIISYNDTVKEALSIALLQIMKDKNFYNITIIELAQKAGVGRSSFYRNFESKEALLIYYIKNQYFTYFNNKINSNFLATTIDTREFFSYRFDFIKENSDLFILLRKYDLLEYVFIHMPIDLSNYLSGNIVKQSQYHHAMFSSCCAGVIRCWIDNKFDKSVDELVSLFLSINSNTLIN